MGRDEAEPVVWPAAAWVPVYFGDAGAPSEAASQLHRVLTADPLLDAAEFRAFVTARRDVLGDLHIYRSGRLDCIAPGTPEGSTPLTSRTFPVTSGTSAQLIELSGRGAS